MDDFFKTFLTTIYKILVGLFVIILILDVAKYLFKRKYIEFVLRSPEEVRQRLMRSSSLVVSVYKMLFWLAPIILLMLPLAIYLFFPNWFWQVTVMAILFYMVLLEDFLYRRSFLKAIRN
jgi:hypothetical protein